MIKKEYLLAALIAFFVIILSNAYLLYGIFVPKEGMEFIKRMYGEKALTEYKMFSTHHVNSLEKIIIKLLKPIPITVHQ